MKKITSHGRREFLQGGAAMLAVATWMPDGVTLQRQDRTAVHGMLLVGEETAFLSHLPMFSAPHDFQAILEARFTKAGSNPQADYFADRKRTGIRIYSLEPARFVLPQLVAAEPLRSFKGNLYRGHFERFSSQAAKDAARIAQDVDVTVTGVVTFRQFVPEASRTAQLEYLVFGKGRERFLAHGISAAPDFDQVLRVALDPELTDREIVKGVRIQIPDRANASKDRIRGTDAVSARLVSDGIASRTLQLRPGDELYFEENELA
ncbi:hypothetical protein LuPra_02799 [Luteitalea pratensis]|uniref:Uncharacterized protein n=1 Tax=Luteitalea pratensis TaxID=1855912 RepID=A0A143PN41_LUTPR|nr:hypothetical protein [Luteitalea pratensis]AMY09580.1 hypothetical protein LuPra_02799 [Luteitalea pratensis]